MVGPNGLPDLVLRTSGAAGEGRTLGAVVPLGIEVSILVHPGVGIPIGLGSIELS